MDYYLQYDNNTRLITSQLLLSKLNGTEYDETSILNTINKIKTEAKLSNIQQDYLSTDIFNNITDMKDCWTNPYGFGSITYTTSTDGIKSFKINISKQEGNTWADGGMIGKLNITQGTKYKFYGWIKAPVNSEFRIGVRDGGGSGENIYVTGTGDWIYFENIFTAAKTYKCVEASDTDPFTCIEIVEKEHTYKEKYINIVLHVKEASDTEEPYVETDIISEIFPTLTYATLVNDFEQKATKALSRSNVPWKYEDATAILNALQIYTRLALLYCVYNGYINTDADFKNICLGQVKDLNKYLSILLHTNKSSMIYGYLRLPQLALREFKLSNDTYDKNTAFKTMINKLTLNKTDGYCYIDLIGEKYYNQIYNGATDDTLINLTANLNNMTDTMLSNLYSYKSVYEIKYTDLLWKLLNILPRYQMSTLSAEDMDTLCDNINKLAETKRIKTDSDLTKSYDVSLEQKCFNKLSDDYNDTAVNVSINTASYRNTTRDPNDAWQSCYVKYDEDTLSKYKSVTGYTEADYNKLQGHTSPNYIDIFLCTKKDVEIRLADKDDAVDRPSKNVKVHIQYNKLNSTYNLVSAKADVKKTYHDSNPTIGLDITEAQGYYLKWQCKWIFDSHSEDCKYYMYYDSSDNKLKMHYRADEHHDDMKSYWGEANHPVDVTTDLAKITVTSNITKADIYDYYIANPRNNDLFGLTSVGPNTTSGTNVQGYREFCIHVLNHISSYNVIHNSYPNLNESTVYDTALNDLIYSDNFKYKYGAQYDYLLNLMQALTSKTIWSLPDSIDKLMDSDTYYTDKMFYSNKYNIISFTNNEDPYNVTDPTDIKINSLKDSGTYSFNYYFNMMCDIIKTKYNTDNVSAFMSNSQNAHLVLTEVFKDMVDIANTNVDSDTECLWNLLLFILTEMKIIHISYNNILSDVADIFKESALHKCVTSLYLVSRFYDVVNNAAIYNTTIKYLDPAYGDNGYKITDDERMQNKIGIMCYIKYALCAINPDDHYYYHKSCVMVDEYNKNVAEIIVFNRFNSLSKTDNLIKCLKLLKVRLGIE